MALTEQQIRQITDEIVRSLTKSMKEEVPAAPPQTDGCTGRRTKLRVCLRLFEIQTLTLL